MRRTLANYAKALKVLPQDVAVKAKWCAWHASWHAANNRASLPDDSKKDLANFESHAKKCDDFRHLQILQLSMLFCLALEIR